MFILVSFQVESVLTQLRACNLSVTEIEYKEKCILTQSLRSQVHRIQEVPHSCLFFSYSRKQERREGGGLLHVDDLSFKFIVPQKLTHRLRCRT